MADAEARPCLGPFSRSDGIGHAGALGRDLCEDEVHRPWDRGQRGRDWHSLAEASPGTESHPRCRFENFVGRPGVYTGAPTHRHSGLSKGEETDWARRTADSSEECSWVPESVVDNRHCSFASAPVNGRGTRGDTLDAGHKHTDCRRSSNTCVAPSDVPKSCGPEHAETCLESAANFPTERHCAGFTKVLEPEGHDLYPADQTPEQARPGRLMPRRRCPAGTDCRAVVPLPPPGAISCGICGQIDDGTIECSTCGVRGCGNCVRDGVCLECRAPPPTSAASSLGPSAPAAPPIQVEGFPSRWTQAGQQAGARDIHHRQPRCALTPEVAAQSGLGDMSNAAYGEAWEESGLDTQYSIVEAATTADTRRVRSRELRPLVVVPRCLDKVSRGPFVPFGNVRGAGLPRPPPFYTTCGRHPGPEMTATRDLK